MIIIDVLVAGWCASCLANKKNKNLDFGRRHTLHLSESKSNCAECPKKK